MAFDIMSGGAILLAILIALTTVFRWPSWLNYIWAALALIWGVAGATNMF